MSHWRRARREPAGNAGLHFFEPLAGGGDLSHKENLQEAVMIHWHDTMVERPATDTGVYATGWTISGVAVIGTIVAIWLLGI